MLGEGWVVEEKNGNGAVMIGGSACLTYLLT